MEIKSDIEILEPQKLEENKFQDSDCIDNKDVSQETEKKKEESFEKTGILQIVDGYGFLRFHNFLTSSEDIFLSTSMIQKMHLRTGDEVTVLARPPRVGERFGAAFYVKTVNGDSPAGSSARKQFDRLTPIFPNRRIKLETKNDLSTRIIDLIAPIGFGQRGLIVAQPKAGKTILLKKIARSIETYYPEAELLVLLVDERPEEVTDIERFLTSNSRVIYSTFDERPEHHIKVAEMVLERAKRLAECGKDVVILLDSLTRLARAYNIVAPSSGKVLSGGLDPVSLYYPKKFFGAARNIEEGGSITILATALVDTGSRMDDMIYEEFKGTGNMELHLDRKLSEMRIFPAIDMNKSGTRNEELLISQEELEAVWTLRKALSKQENDEITETIISKLAITNTNKDFVELITKMGFSQRKK